MKHLIKEGSSVATPLQGLVDIEIENAEWLDFFDASIISTYKQIAFSNFQESNSLLPLSEHVQSVVRVEKLHTWSNGLW